MCVLCAVHRVSQVVPSMLPWVVAPLLALWAASQLLPPPLRFEVTPPRLACALFLLAVLLWHHVLMPQLLTWQARRSARMQERRRFLAVELQRLRRSAVRRCRNCLTEYRDQNPPAGRFMCCYCGHVSKRPVFDLPGGSGILHELLAGAGMCADGLGPPHRWLVGSIPDKPPYPRRLLSMLLGTIQWLRDKIPMGSGRDDPDADDKDLSKEGGRADCSESESKCEKARRKAEERRQARLEREMQEEEERKQREEVFRLIEEQRKLRDEKLEAVKEALRSSALDVGRDGRKDYSVKKRSVRKKEKDCLSSKSNSDVEESIERRCELEKKLESERQQGCRKSFFLVENSRKAHALENPPQGFRGMVNSNKPRYFDRFRGSFFTYNSSNNGKGAHNVVVPSSKPSKPIGWSVGSTGDLHSSGHVPGKQSLNGDDKAPSVAANQCPAIAGQPQPNVWKNRTHRLFKNSLAITPIAPPNGQMSQNNDQQSPTHNSSKNSSNVAQTLPFSSHPYIDCPVGSDLASLVTQGASESLPSVDDTFHSSISEEGELFEDPCYVPDPVELLGPVSESLDNFPVDAGCGFATQTSLKGSGPVADDSIFNNIAANISPSLNFPMPTVDMAATNDNIASMDFHGTSVAEDSHVSKVEGNIASEPDVWHMWDSSLRLNPLGVIGGSSGWLLPIEEDESERKAVQHPSCKHTSLNPIEGRLLSGINSPLINYAGKSENGDTFAKLEACLTDSVPWMRKGAFQSNDTRKIIPLKLQETADVSEVSHDSPSRSPSGPSYEVSWSKADWPALGCQGCEDGGRAVLPRPNNGGPFHSDSDVQSLWSFSLKKKKTEESVSK